jgi:hypothetical protein
MIPISRPSDSSSAAGPAPAEPQCLPAGTAVGSFLLQDVQARDDFSIRYLATSSTSGGKVVIEEFAPAEISLRDTSGLLKPRAAADTALWEEGLRAFVEESELLARPLHASLIRVAATWQVRGTAYRLWPRIEGRPLAEICASMPEPPTEEWLRDLVASLLDALESLHDAGWVHGNVSPGQILIQPDGSPILLDTAAVRTTIGARMPQRSAWPEAAFRAPELAQAQGEHAPGPWSDLYSLAKVAKFCMNASHASGDISLDGSDLPTDRYTSGLVSAVERSLAIDPRQRPQSVAALRLLLLSTVAPAAHRPRQGAPDSGLALSDIPLLTIPFNERKVLRSEPKPIQRELDSTSLRVQSESAPHRASGSRGERRALRRQHTRRWPWAVAGALGTLGVLVVAALVTVQMTGYHAPQLAGITLPKLPWLENLIERDPAAAGTMAAGTPESLPMPLKVDPPQTSTRPLAPMAVDIGRAVAPAAVSATRESPLSAVVPTATASPTPVSDPTRRDAVPDTPAAACAPRTNFALYRCMQSQCEQQHYYAHSQCVRLRRFDELPA